MVYRSQAINPFCLASYSPASALAVCQIDHSGSAENNATHRVIGMAIRSAMPTELY